MDGFHWEVTEDERVHRIDDDSGAVIPDGPLPEPEAVLDKDGKVKHYEEAA